VFKDTQAALSSAYAEAQIDVDPNYKPNEIPAYKRFTFLSVFAIPALVDILMLSTTGHGLYLSGFDFMTADEQHSATTALMISLLLSGAIGTWITCGGGYYLNSMAFSAMNYFVITRLLGGFAFTLIVGVVGFIAFAATTSAYRALIFLLYLIVLTLYLSLLAALANYQFTGSAFQSVSLPPIKIGLHIHQHFASKSQRYLLMIIGPCCDSILHSGTVSIAINHHLRSKPRHHSLPARVVRFCRPLAIWNSCNRISLDDMVPEDRTSNRQRITRLVPKPKGR
jgi:hypothetical protein